MFVSRWTVDYGDGPNPVVLPHAWGQDVSVEWEGPAVYRTGIDVPRGGGTLRFWGASYDAEVFANGLQVAHHKGIWDAFDVPLPGGRVEVEARVVKNGGPTYPVGSVASGGLPYLFNTFGGLYREVELLEEPKPLLLPPPARREPLPYVRGVVHRGWYPDLGYPNPDEGLVRREVREIKALGFNTIKFAGWVPPHRYLDILEAEGLLGWLELPMGQSGLHLDHIDAIGEEIERIVRQYRHHPSLALWTVCDDFCHHALPRSFLRGLTDMVRAQTGCDWVADSPLEGAVPRDYDPYGTFDDLRADETPRTLDALQPGPYPARPVLLGEYGGDPCHRDLARLGDELPYWASALPELNPNPELPRLLEASRFALEPTRSGHKPLLASSRSQRAFRLKVAVENARARAGWIHGYAVEELRDTPVSSSGLFDDWGKPRLSPEESARWNGPICLYLLPRRRFAWEGFAPVSTADQFSGEVRLSLGAHADSPLESALWWRIIDEAGRTVVRGGGNRTTLEGARLIGEAYWPDAVPGSYRLEAGFGSSTNEWDLWVVERETPQERDAWKDDVALAYGEPSSAPSGVLVLRKGDEGVVDHSGYFDFQFDDGFPSKLPLRDRWSRLARLERNASLDPEWLTKRFGTYEVLLNGINSQRVEVDHPILVRAGKWMVTTLDPGNRNALTPTGTALIRALMESVEPTR